MTITEFLLARIAEDEAAVTESTRRLAPEGHELIEQFGDFGDDERWMIEIPAGRVLAECEAKRQIVRAESRTRVKADAPTHRRSSSDGHVVINLPRPGGHDELRGEAASEFIEEWYEPSPPSRVLRALAAVYADDPDYDPAWQV